MRYDDGGWRDHAACKGQDPDLWVQNPTSRHRRVESRIDDERAQYAKQLAVCARCDVQGECLSWALQATSVNGSPIQGCLGGTTDAERKRIRRQLDQPTGLVRRQPPVHGTRSRYTGGCRCAACRTANTMYQPGAAS